MRTVRDLPPSQYSLKIESFSSLVKSQKEKYESGAFLAGGYSWKLILYPNGNKQDDGQNHISLYLEIEDTSSLRNGWEVNMEAKLFVFDQRRKKYLTIQDDIGSIKHFNKTETRWGFAKLLPLDDFNNANYGYLVNDCCQFGAEVFVIQPTQKHESLSMPQEQKNAEKGISRVIREVAPAHYLFEIDSFLSISKHETENSRTFEAGGFNWMLSLYPNGRKNRDGDGHISLYLRIVETETFAPNWEVNVIYRLFVFDKKRDNYLTIQDAAGVVRRFHESKTEWGFSQLISLKDFKKDYNGYLVEDRCSFGAEVFVINHTDKQDGSSMVKEPTNNTFTWRLEKISTLTEDFYKSEQFIMAGTKWNFEVYPKGYGKAKGKSLSLFVSLSEKSVPRIQEWHAKFKLNIRGGVGDHHFERSYDRVVKYSTYGWGHDDFISLTELNDETKGYTRFDVVTFDVIFTFLSMNQVFIQD